MLDDEVMKECKSEFSHKVSNGYERIIAAEKVLNMLSWQQYAIVRRKLQANNENITKKFMQFCK